MSVWALLAVGVVLYAGAREVRSYLYRRSGAVRRINLSPESNQYGSVSAVLDVVEMAYLSEYYHSDFMLAKYEAPTLDEVRTSQV